MKKKLLLFILLTTSFLLSAQDIIIRSNGKKIHCKVLNIDSTNVYFDTGQDLFTDRINKKEVKEIQYGQPSPISSTSYSQLDNNGPKNSITIGFLEGGGSLVGVDYEVLFSRSVGIQLGAGLVGFGASLNDHFKPTIRSSYISLQYWHQGFRNSYTQSLIGPSFVFRAKRIITAQLGLGFVLEKGPAWPENKTQPPIMLTYAIGIYFPY
jgi:hypothetical protein